MLSHLEASTGSLSASRAPRGASFIRIAYGTSPTAPNTSHLWVWDHFHARHWGCLGIRNWAFLEPKTLLERERGVVILRHRAARNVFERCHISSVTSAELFTRRSPGLAGCGYLCGRRGLQRPPPIRSAGSRRMVPLAWGHGGVQLLSMVLHCPLFMGLLISTIGTTPTPNPAPKD